MAKKRNQGTKRRKPILGIRTFHDPKPHRKRLPKRLRKRRHSRAEKAIKEFVSMPSARITTPLFGGAVLGFMWGTTQGKFHVSSKAIKIKKATREAKAEMHAANLLKKPAEEIKHVFRGKMAEKDYNIKFNNDGTVSAWFSQNINAKAAQDLMLTFEKYNQYILELKSKTETLLIRSPDAMIKLREAEVAMLETELKELRLTKEDIAWQHGIVGATSLPVVMYVALYGYLGYKKLKVGVRNVIDKWENWRMQKARRRMRKARMAAAAKKVAPPEEIVQPEFSEAARETRMPPKREIDQLGQALSTLEKNLNGGEFAQLKNLHSEGKIADPSLIKLGRKAVRDPRYVKVFLNAYQDHEEIRSLKPENLHKFVMRILNMQAQAFKEGVANINCRGLGLPEKMTAIEVMALPKGEKERTASQDALSDAARIAKHFGTMKEFATEDQFQRMEELFNQKKITALTIEKLNELSQKNKFGFAIFLDLYSYGKLSQMLRGDDWNNVVKILSFIWNRGEGQYIQRLETKVGQTFQDRRISNLIMDWARNKLNYDFHTSRRNVILLNLRK